MTYLGNLVSGAKPCTPNLLCHTITLVSKTNIDINSQILYMDSNTDLDAGPHLIQILIWVSKT